MGNNTLANEYRPTKFSDVLGQSLWVEKLAKRVAENRVPPVIIIGGPSGTGKTTTARLIAKACVCQNRPDGQADPCNSCDGCLSVDRGGGDANYMFLDGGGEKLADTVRGELADTMRFKPSLARYKCCIIDEFQAFGHVAKSALLTLFEEMPSTSRIICTTTDAETIHEALRDRAYEISFSPIHPQEQVLGVIRARPDLESYKDQLLLLATHSGGTQRRLWSMVDRLDGDFSEAAIQAVTGISKPSERLRLLRSALDRDFETVDSIWSSWVGRGFNMATIGDLLINDLCKMSIEDPTNLKITKAIKILDRAVVLGKSDIIKRALFMLSEDPIPKLLNMYKGIFHD